MRKIFLLLVGSLRWQILSPFCPNFLGHLRRASTVLRCPLYQTKTPRRGELCNLFLPPFTFTASLISPSSFESISSFGMPCMPLHIIYPFTRKSIQSSLTTSPSSLHRLSARSINLCKGQPSQFYATRKKEITVLKGNTNQKTSSTPALAVQKQKLPRARARAVVHAIALYARKEGGCERKRGEGGGSKEVRRMHSLGKRRKKEKETNPSSRLFINKTFSPLHKQQHHQPSCSSRACPSAP